MCSKHFLCFCTTWRNYMAVKESLTMLKIDRLFGLFSHAWTFPTSWWKPSTLSLPPPCSEHIHLTLLGPLNNSAGLSSSCLQKDPPSTDLTGIKWKYLMAKTEMYETISQAPEHENLCPGIRFPGQSRPCGWVGEESSPSQVLKPKTLFQRE